MKVLPTFPPHSHSTGDDDQLLTLLEGVSIGQGRDDIRTALVYLVIQGAIASDLISYGPTQIFLDHPIDLR